MPTRPSLFRLVALAAAVLSAACTIRFDGPWQPTVWIEESETIVLAAGDLDRLALASHHGSVKVEAGPGDEVRIVVRKRIGGRDAADAQLARAALQVVQVRDGRALEVRGQWPSVREETWQAQLDFEASVPARFALDLDSHHGDVAASGVQGAIDASSHHGEARLLDCGPQVHARSHHGSVTAQGAIADAWLSSHHGDVDLATTCRAWSGVLHSHHGDVRIDLPPHPLGTLRGDADGHAFELEGTGAAITIDDDDFCVRLPEPGAGLVEIDTHHGSVRVR